MLTELNWQSLADRRRIARLVMFYKIHYHLVAINMTLESKLCLAPTRTENSLTYVMPTSPRDYYLYSFIIWVLSLSYSYHLLILSNNSTWMELLTTRLSPAWHSWSFQKCTNICLTWSWALHCHAVNGSRIPQRSQRFASILRTAQDYTIADYCTVSLWSQLTACHAHPTSSAGAFSLLKFAL